VPAGSVPPHDVEAAWLTSWPDGAAADVRASDPTPMVVSNPAPTTTTSDAKTRAIVDLVTFRLPLAGKIPRSGCHPRNKLYG